MTSSKTRAAPWHRFFQEPGEIDVLYVLPGFKVVSVLPELMHRIIERTCQVFSTAPSTTVAPVFCNLPQETVPYAELKGEVAFCEQYPTGPTSTGGTVPEPNPLAYCRWGWG